jgi:hypothetical protein
MNAPMVSTNVASPATARVKRPERGDLEATIHALGGIFWALNMLVVHHAADDIAHDEDRLNGIDALILAGNQLASETAERF